jgi:hypothetical protein
VSRIGWVCTIGGSSLAFAALLVAGGRTPASQATRLSAPVPPIQARRIAAQCSGGRTYVPSSTPVGFRFSGWQVFAHNVFCDVGFAIRFRRGSSLLTWEVGGPQTFKLPCDRNGLAVAHLSGRVVYRRVAGGLEKVWACLRLRGYTLTLLAFQHVGAGQASGAQLEQIVAGADALPAARAPRGTYELPPANDVRNLSARFGSPFYLPTELPDGFVFSQWKVRSHDPNIDNRKSLYVTFGRDGAALDWDVFAGTDTSGLDCPVKKTSLSPKPFTVIDGVRIFLIVGIHGGSAWRCIPAHTVGNARPLEISVWYSIAVDSPAMEREVSELVADARLVGR